MNVLRKTKIGIKSTHKKSSTCAKSSTVGPTGWAYKDAASVAVCPVVVVGGGGGGAVAAAAVAVLAVVAAATDAAASASADDTNVLLKI